MQIGYNSEREKERERVQIYIFLSTPMDLTGLNISLFLCYRLVRT